MIENMSTHCRQKMGTLYHVRDFLGPRGLAVAFKSFVRPVCEYFSVAVMGAAATLLSKLDMVLKMAEKLSECAFPSLHACREASAVGLLYKLLDFFQSQGPLQQFCLTFATAPLIYSYCLRSLNDNPLSLSSSVQYTSLDLFRSFLGAISNIWASMYSFRHQAARF